MVVFLVIQNTIPTQQQYLKKVTILFCVWFGLVFAPNNIMTLFEMFVCWVRVGRRDSNVVFF